MISAGPVAPESKAASDEWFTLPKLFLLLAAFVVMAFPSVVIGTNSFFYRDMGQFGYPLALFHREAFWHGEIPLWNPLNNCGLPFLAQWNTLVLYPGSLLYLLLPLPWSMNFFMFVHLFLAAAGMYALARRWTDNRCAASVAGLAFAWNGLMLHTLMWPNNMAAFGWMPWVVLALERAWREGGRRVYVAVLVASMQMLAGAPEIILLTWLIVGVLWLRDFLKGSGAAVPAAIRPAGVPPAVGPLVFQANDPLAGTAQGRVAAGTAAPLGKVATRRIMLLRFALCGALVFAVCAAQLLPFLDLLRHSNRDASFGGTSWAMPLSGWVNFLVPMFGLTPSVVGVYSQDSQQWTSSYFLGVITVAFALLAFRSGEARVKWLALLALGGLLLSFGDDGLVLKWLKKVCPLLGFIRFPIKYVVLVMFALPLLAAFGVKAWLADESVRARRWLEAVFVGLLLALVAIIGWAKLHPSPGVEWKTVEANMIARETFLLLAIGVLSLSRIHRLSRFLTPRLAFAVVLILMAADVLWHMPSQNPVVPNRAYDSVEFKMTRVPRLGEGRAMISPPLQEAMMGLAHPDPFTMFNGHRRMLLSDCNLLDGIPKVNGFYSLYVREADEVTRRLYSAKNFDLPLLDFLGVTQLSDNAELFVWHEHTNALPLITAGQTPVIVSASNSLDAIFSPAFDPRRVVYLPAEARALAGEVHGGGCVINSSEFKREVVRAEVSATAPSLVVVAQAYTSSWRAEVDGRPVPLWRANHAYQAVLVPAGKHRVELRYRDRWFQSGVVISALSLVLCVVMVARRRSRP